LGRYGPFVLHDGMYANLESIEDVFTVGLNRAVALIAEKAAGGKSRFQRAKPTVLKDLGEHPGGGGKIQVLDGKYGPYVTHDKVNATVPKGTDPATLSVDDAIRLLRQRIAKGGGKKPARKAKAKSAKAAKSDEKGAKPTKSRGSKKTAVADAEAET